MISLPANYNKLSSKQRAEVRKQYAELQNGKCKHCNEPLSGPPSSRIQMQWVNRSLFPPNFFAYNNHLHHDHNTGITIGTVHSRCNAVLWQYHNE